MTALPPTVPRPPAFALHLVTLAVDDLERACAFYAALGLERRRAEMSGVAFFEAGNVALSLYPRGSLAADLGRPVPPASGPSTLTLACNVAHAAEVAAMMKHAAAAGATVLRPAGPIVWGGIVGYFADPDGHVWEVAFNPFFPFDAQGRIQMGASVDDPSGSA